MGLLGELVNWYMLDTCVWCCFLLF